MKCRSLPGDAKLNGAASTVIAKDLGIALLAPAVVPEGRGLVTVPVTDGPKRVEYLAWCEFNPSPAASAFVEEALASLGAE